MEPEQVSPDEPPQLPSVLVAVGETTGPVDVDEEAAAVGEFVGDEV